MPITAAGTYTTKVGSQAVELPLVALSDELTIALLISVDMGVAFLRGRRARAGRAHASGRAGHRRVRRHHGDPPGHRGQPRPRARRLRDPPQDAQDPPGRSLGRARLLHHDGQAAEAAHGPRPGRRRPRAPGRRRRRRRLHRRLAVVGPAPRPAHGGRARRHRHDDDRGRRLEAGPRRGCRARCGRSARCRCSTPTARAASSRTGTDQAFSRPSSRNSSSCAAVSRPRTPRQARAA